VAVSMMVMLFAEEEAMVFIAAQVVMHDLGQEINHPVDFLFRHAGNQRTEKAIIAEPVKKGDQRLLVSSAIESKKHSANLLEFSTRLCGCVVRQTRRKKCAAKSRAVTAFCAGLL